MKWFEFYLFSQGITEIRYVHFCHVVWDILPTMFLPSRLLCFVIFLTSFTIHRVGLNWWLRCFIFSFALSPSPLLPELRCDVCCYHDYCFLSVFFCDGSVDNFGFFPPLCIIFFTTDTRAPHRTAPCTWFWSQGIIMSSGLRFTLLGSLLLERFIRRIIFHFSSSFPQAPCREYFGRLSQIAMILSMEDPSEACVYCDELLTRMTEIEIKRVLSLRSDFRVTDINALRVKLWTRVCAVWDCLRSFRNPPLAMKFSYAIS